ncbi:MAG: ABC transporter ATP-binding protein [Mycoplasma sp.]|nr:ABC transporter ATP-binding protein [Mycoplasma sp.]
MILNKKYIQIKNLSKKNGKKEIINNISFDIAEGSFHGLLGLNGSGKTTIIKTIVGAYNNYEGKITINNKINNSPDIKKYIGYVPERPVFPKNEKVLSYLKYMGTLSGIPIKKAELKAEKLLKEYNLSHLSKNNVNNISSGEKKKIMLIQALINDPKILILDEPASNLDAISRIEFLNSLIKLNEKGATIIITSHILSEIEGILTDATFIKDGKLIYNGTIKNIINTHKNLTNAFVFFIKEGGKNV